MTEAPLLPDLSTLPNVEEIAQLTIWLAEAGLSAMELSNASGGKLRIAVAQAPAAAPQPVPEAPETRTATAPYFGRLALCHPLRQEPFAPVGARVCKGDTIALLTLDTLQLPVTAPADGTVVEVLAQEDMLLGYGAGILTIRP
ncbi:biotin/lipoyl-containing protein [Gluconacetobacter sp. Hr-1-5]|uniref:biotin/lipoyl-containing protein n=1 Tax=Gluconacetobacter sp. Hr-1-5 TaxID=3395370 RepID=UPI003B52BE8C